MYGGKYTVEELQRIMEINARPNFAMKPLNPFYKKSNHELGPSNAEKKEVYILITKIITTII